jgi:hypothetical protein
VTWWSATTCTIMRNSGGSSTVWLDMELVWWSEHTRLHMAWSVRVVVIHHPPLDCLTHPSKFYMQSQSLALIPCFTRISIAQESARNWPEMLQSTVLWRSA